MAKDNGKLVVMRADNGDWSLHPPISKIEVGPVPTLMSGPARRIGTKWDRPNELDYQFAGRMLSEHESRQKGGG